MHLIRYALDFASWKDRKLLATALKPIYTAASAEAAAAELVLFSRLLARSIDDPHHEGATTAASRIGTNIPPYPTHATVPAHPTAARPGTIHHGPALCERNTAGQQGCGNNSHRKQILHERSQMKDTETREHFGSQRVTSLAASVTSNGLHA